VNSSVQQYGQYVFYLERWNNWLISAYEAQVKVDKFQAGEQLAHTLREIDPAACELETAAGLETHWGGEISHIELTGWSG
jgi:hypothetical protein